MCQRLALQGHDSSFLKIETGEHTQIHLNEVGNGNFVAEMEKLLNEELDELRHKVGDPIIIPSDNLDDTSTQNEDAPALVLEQMFLAFGFQREGYESWNKMGKVNVVTASMDKDTSIVLCAVNDILNQYCPANTPSPCSKPMTVAEFRRFFLVHDLSFGGQNPVSAASRLVQETYRCLPVPPSSVNSSSSCRVASFTLQFYQATSNGIVSAEDMNRFAQQIEQVYAKAEAIGSLVTQGETGRGTEYQGPS